MNRPRALHTAISAADSAVLLQAPEQVHEAAKAWRRSERLGLDTEFVRERTYHANIGLVQVSDGRTVWLLDPLVEGNLEPLAELLEDRGVAKIVHSPSEDYELLLHAVGALPRPALDTQVACAMLGQPLQVGYHTAVEWLFGVEVDKGQTRSNWCARPLRSEQLHYAALDVCLLPLMWEQLEARLRERGRLEWFHEDCNRQLEQSAVPANDGATWQRIRGLGRLDGTSLAVLQALAGWREREARKRNRPRGFIVPDPVLVHIAERKLTEPRALEDLEDLHPRAAQRYGRNIAEIVSSTLDAGSELPVISPLTGSQRKLLRRLRARVLERANELDVEPALLAPKRDIEELIRNGGDLPARLTGWRTEVITNDLVKILNGGS